MIFISRNQANEIELEKTVSKNHKRKMPIFNCSCGLEILIIPNVHEMNKAIKNHLIEHRKSTGQGIAEETLIQEILNAVMKAINET